MKAALRISKPLWAIGAAALLGGCANLSGVGGSSEYHCKAPEGVRCTSVSGTYFNALANNLPGQRARSAGLRHDDGERIGSAVDGQKTASNTSTKPRVSTRPQPDIEAQAGLPLRTDPQVVRFWIKAWEDSDHDLNGDMLVWMQVDAGHWTPDHVQQATRDAFAPIRPPVTGSVPSDATRGTSAPRPTTEAMPGASLRPDTPVEPRATDPVRPLLPAAGNR